MKKPILTIEELKKLQFLEINGDKLDNDGYYRWWAFHKNDCELHITYKYSSNDEFVLGYAEFNGEQLQGREITANDLNLLIELM